MTALRPMHSFPERLLPQSGRDTEKGRAGYPARPVPSRGTRRGGVSWGAGPVRSLFALFGHPRVFAQFKPHRVQHREHRGQRKAEEAAQLSAWEVHLSGGDYAGLKLVALEAGALLAEQDRPSGELLVADALGLAVPGMPYGSPGMGPESQREAYDVFLIRRDGSNEVFTSYAAA